jgi:hypothetical protein
MTLAPGSLAMVSAGPSAGKVVRLVRSAYAPPGCDGRAIHTLQPHGPIWVVSEWLEWDVQESRGVRRYRLMVAPWTALEVIPEHGKVIDCRRLSRWTSRRGC